MPRWSQFRNVISYWNTVAFRTIYESDSIHPTSVVSKISACTTIPLKFYQQYVTTCESYPPPCIHVCHLEWHTSPQTLLRECLCNICQGFLSHNKCLYTWYIHVYIQKELGSFASLNHNIYIAADRIPVVLKPILFRGIVTEYWPSS